MSEEEWLECTDPKPMLESLRGKASDRKLLLVAAPSFGPTQIERYIGRISGPTIHV